MKQWHNKIVAGVTRTGKTTDEIRELQWQDPTALKFFVNSKNEKQWNKHCYFNSVTDKYKIDPVDAVEMAFENREQFAQGGIVNLRPSDPKRPYEQLAECIDLIFEKHFEDNLQNSIMFIDEIYEFQSKRGLGATIRRSFGQGLGIGLKMVIATHRFTQVHNDLIASAEIYKSHMCTWDDLDNHIRKFMRFKEYAFKKGYEWNELIVDKLYPLQPTDMDADIPVPHSSYIQNGKAGDLQVYIPTR